MNSSVGLYFSNCDGEDNTATYLAQPGTTGEIEIQWQVPNDYLGEIVFQYEETLSLQKMSIMKHRIFSQRNNLSRL